MPVVFILGGSLVLLLYLWHVSRAINSAPQEATELAQKSWTALQMEDAMKMVRKSPTDVRPFLFPKKDRRYVVVGGSGLVGGWIVQHLLLRGEQPEAIRILDVSPPSREDANDRVEYVSTDVSDLTAVERGFGKSWPGAVSSLPLTVFHCVAYISARDRHSEMATVYVRVNVKGTENVLKVAREAGATCFVATSSASVAIRPPSFFPYPWQRWPTNIYQFLPNAEALDYDTPLKDCASCYTWSKLKAEKLVLEANTSEFATGAIRPGHAVYGHGIAATSSVVYDYLRRGGSPTWMWNVIANFVNAQNVSIGHLAYEDALLNEKHSGGKAYCVTDPNPPIRYGDLYKFLETMAHRITPVRFPKLPYIVMLLLSYPMEQYILLHRLRLRWLPAVHDDLTYLQPGIFRVSTLHIVYTDTKAQEEINYKAPIQTIEGFALSVLDWNSVIDRKLGEPIN